MPLQPVKLEGLPENYVAVTLEDLATPRDGYIVHLDRWWLVYNEHALLYQLRKRWPLDLRPLCNKDRRVGDSFMKRFPGAEMRFVPIAYVPQPRYD